MRSISIYTDKKLIAAYFYILFEVNWKTSLQNHKMSQSHRHSMENINHNMENDIVKFGKNSTIVNSVFQENWLCVKTWNVDIALKWTVWHTEHICTTKYAQIELSGIEIFLHKKFTNPFIFAMPNFRLFDVLLPYVEQLLQISLTFLLLLFHHNREFYTVIRN